MVKFSWKKKGGYEVSTMGDRRFSALNATLEDGRTIEMHYQCDLKGYDVGGTDWKMGKGKPSLNPEIDSYLEYKTLWFGWACRNKSLMLELRNLALEHKNLLSDGYATSKNNQAKALSDILTDGLYLTVDVYQDS